MNILYKIYNDLRLSIPNLIQIGALLTVTIIAVKISTALINKFFENKSRLKIIGEEKRLNTIKSIMVSIVKYTIYFIGLTPILGIFEINIGSLIAAAGVGGLAIGFGAQSLIKDIITGFFILLENQFQVGDHVVVDNLSGIVEEMTLRVTILRDFNGDMHIIPNGTINRLTNKCRGSMRAWIEVGVAYEENIDHVIDRLNHLFDTIENENIIGKAQTLGVTNFGASEVTIGIIARCKPLNQ
jgi:small conductance mechanosensitive channel